MDIFSFFELYEQITNNLKKALRENAFHRAKESKKKTSICLIEKNQSLIKNIL